MSAEKMVRMLFQWNLKYNSCYDIPASTAMPLFSNHYFCINYIKATGHLGMIFLLIMNSVCIHNTAAAALTEMLSIKHGASMSVEKYISLEFNFKLQLSIYFSIWPACETIDLFNFFFCNSAQKYIEPFAWKRVWPEVFN